MQNVDYKVKDGKLVITVDLTKDYGPSKSGKTLTVASSGGFQKIEGTNIAFALNVNKKDGN